jgi:hypothetical protein
MKIKYPKKVEEDIQTTVIQLLSIVEILFDKILMK